MTPPASATPLGEGLPPKMRQALAMFIAGASYAEIARTVRRSVGTVRNWFSDPRMKAALDRELWAIKEMAAAMLTGHAPDAVRVILEGLTAERFSDRLRAAESLLDKAGIKATGPRLTQVDLPQVIEVVEAGGGEPSPGGPRHKGCFDCDPAYRERWWWRNVMRRALAVSEHREPAPRMTTV